jgi:predicted kinase
MNKNLVLIRGLPGSGKTTLAVLLSENNKYPICSIDEYFTDQLGNYEFNHLKNHIAYDECLKKVERNMKNNVMKIFVDHTLTIDWELEPYFKLAQQHQYKVFVITVENYHGGTNVHGITDEQMEKMSEKYKVRLKP